MPRKQKPWFRFYSETPRDRKVRRLTMTQRWLWVCILCAAGESPERGRLLIAEGVAMNAAELADYADVKPRDVRPAIDAMTKLGMVEMDQGVLVVCNWGRRQYESDDVTRRVRAFRERSRNVPTDDDETLQPGSLERSSNGRSNTPETEAETEPEELPLGGNRNDTYRASSATEPPQCSTHPDGNAPGPCGGCAKVTAWKSRNEIAARDAAQRAREQCPDCHGAIWLDNGTKCTHPATRRTA